MCLSSRSCFDIIVRLVNNIQIGIYEAQVYLHNIILTMLLHIVGGGSDEPGDAGKEGGER